MSEKDKIIEDAQDIEALLETNGWKLLETWIKVQIEIGKENLLKVPVDKVVSTRAKIKAYQSILNKVDEFLSEAKFVKEEK